MLLPWQDWKLQRFGLDADAEGGEQDQDHRGDGKQPCSPIRGTGKCCSGGSTVWSAPAAATLAARS
jgi:hypothetical protein